MMNLKFHHIGIACEDIDKNAAFISQFLPIVQDTGTIYEPNQDISLRLLTARDGNNLELVAGPKVQSLVKKGSAITTFAMKRAHSNPISSA